MYEWQFTKWLIDYLDNWRLCVFFRKFLLYSTYFLQKKLNHQKKPFSGIKKNSKTFFPSHYSLKMITWPYTQGIRLVKVVLFFFKNYLNQFLKKMKWFFKSFLDFFSLHQSPKMITWSLNKEIRFWFKYTNSTQISPKIFEAE
jgi:hypothetical protein